MIFSTNVARRMLTSLASVECMVCAPNLTVWPHFFSPHEQHVLLRTALQKLDDTETPRARRKMKEYIMGTALRNPPLLHELFLPDDYYNFQEGHFDGVIHHYREMHLNSWPENEIAGLSPILERLYNIFPTKKVQTHLLHLASDGEILPHIDNVEASGSWIMGVSLGAERILRMEDLNSTGNIYEVPLPSGSIYLQRDSMRYQFKHSILKGGSRDHESDTRIRQRLSIMIRDLPPSIDRSAAATL